MLAVILGAIVAVLGFALWAVWPPAAANYSGSDL